MVQTRILRWGNSRGVRIPRPMLEQIGIHTEIAEITLEVRENEIILRPTAPHPRAGWAESFAAMVANKEDVLVWPEGMVDTFDQGNTW